MSRPRSAPTSGRSSTAPARGGRPGVYVSAPKSDIFVVLLAVSLGAMVVGSLLFVLIMSRYDFKTKVSANSNVPVRTVLALNTTLPVVAPAFS